MRSGREFLRFHLHDSIVRLLPFGFGILPWFIAVLIGRIRSRYGLEAASLCAYEDTRNNGQNRLDQAKLKQRFLFKKQNRNIAAEATITKKKGDGTMKIRIDIRESIDIYDIN
uniref:Uncharacterized protein n=1 Tax=Romanomermis culicivorax TaxID=13658 RepID=A0A915HJK5_ROMCU